MAREIFINDVNNGIMYTSTEKVYSIYDNIMNTVMEVEQTLFYFNNGRKLAWYKGYLYHENKLVLITSNFDTLAEWKKAYSALVKG